MADIYFSGIAHAGSRYREYTLHDLWSQWWLIQHHIQNKRFLVAYNLIRTPFDLSMKIPWSIGLAFLRLSAAEAAPNFANVISAADGREPDRNTIRLDFAARVGSSFEKHLRRIRPTVRCGKVDHIDAMTELFTICVSFGTRL